MIRNRWAAKQKKTQNRLSGAVIGPWTVGSQTRTNSSNPDGFRTYHLCVCTCGHARWINEAHLVTGKTPTPTCHAHTGSQHASLRTQSDVGIPKRSWSGILASAKHRGIPVEITAKEAWSIFMKQKRRCALTGQIIHFGNEGEYPTASLDRRDSALPYRADNCQWLHKTVNRLKWNMPEHELLALCEQITKHNTRPANSSVEA